MLKAEYVRRDLKFIKPAGTSRGILYDKPSWYLRLSDGVNVGIGECSIIPGLSIDPIEEIDTRLQFICDHINEIHSWDLKEMLGSFPALQFCVEMALLDLQHPSGFVLYPSAFTQGLKAIPINGLVWMGDRNAMLQQIKDKLAMGFSCIKLKIGAILWEEEKQLLKYIRSHYPKEKIELRVDANGGFTPEEAPEILKELAELDIHSIEQPIYANQHVEMAELCKNTPIAIALDEELIGIQDPKEKKDLLDKIRPQYIILKPSLLGGFSQSEEWIRLAEERGIGWWATSALESNVGLSAIAQWTATLNNPMPQGLGTGALFHNNIDSPLYLKGDQLFYGAGNWGTKLFENGVD